MPTCRLTDGWLPIPEDLLQQLGWREGDQIAFERVEAGGVLATRIATAPAPPERPAPQRGRSRPSKPARFP